jgi:hypothetical protein
MKARKSDQGEDVTDEEELAGEEPPKLKPTGHEKGGHWHRSHPRTAKGDRRCGATTY